ncbi:hypothetical protein E0Z06_05020 [Rheinheimera sp. D18]|uniref:hypothetical protein n=1 Tax=Rheinheimera sp. D18 TaxID=2545632 RepID=UPI001048A610|nr:hypothetical protein [Rheinheimera sp. D18]QBL08920.1 hypothetical protein E0Z06_05020 [Rheinheimera sp. D18]
MKLKKIAVIVLAILCLITHANASLPTEVVICNICIAPSVYANAAKEAGIGNVIVINIDRREAKAFEIVLDPDYYNEHVGIPLEPSIRHLIAIPQALPADVAPAINGYHELKAAFEEYRSTNAISTYSQGSEILQLNNSIANGCGTPNSPWTYALIPNFPFEAACNAHDICYSSTRSKGSCDDAFKFNMRNTVLQNVIGNWWSSNTGKVLLGLILSSQAEIYYQFVKNHPIAITAYCDATQNTNAAECAPNAPLQGGSGGGYITDNYPHTNGGSIFQSCELWRFPDGLGGYYVLEKNCSFHYIP